MNNEDKDFLIDAVGTAIVLVPLWILLTYAVSLLADMYHG